MSGADKGAIPGATFPGGDSGKPFGSYTIPKKKSTDTNSKATTAEATPTSVTPSSSAPSAGSGGGGGGWSVVNNNKRNKGGKTGSKGNPSAGGQPAGAGAASHRSMASGDLREVWRRDRRCLGCGSESHFIRDCPLVNQANNVSGSQPKDTSKTGKGKGGQPNPSSNNPKGSQPKGKTSAGTGSANVAGGKKRKHSTTPTGQTPPPKRPASKKFSYAATAAGAIEVAVVTKEHGHISKKDFNAIRDAVEEKWASQLEEGKVPFTVEQWSYTSQYATYSVPNTVSAGQVEAVVRDHGFLAMEKETVMNERKPTTILTGLVTGSAAKRDRKMLERMIKFEAQRVEIHGRIEFYSATPIIKSGNLLLRILVDEDAKWEMSKVNDELHIGASGKVKFQDERALRKSSSEYRRRRLQELEQSIEASKKLILDQVKERKELEMDLEKPPPSVGSMGMSSLTVGDVAGDEEPSTEEVKEPVSEKAKEPNTDAAKTVEQSNTVDEEMEELLSA